MTHDAGHAADDPTTAVTGEPLGGVQPGGGREEQVPTVPDDPSHPSDPADGAPSPGPQPGSTTEHGTTGRHRAD